jgi:hypothetical protein
VLIAALAALAFAGGCGGSDGGGVTVQTGSLSRAEFIERADAICEAVRTKLIAEYYQYLKKGAKPESPQELAGELLSILGPNLEREIRQISTLGAPSDYAPEVDAFLEALQERLDRANENPASLNATSSPFKQAEEAAKRAGLDGCVVTAQSS